MLPLQKDDVVIREFGVNDIPNKVLWINDEKNNAYLHYDIPLNEEETLNWFLNKAENRLDCIIEYHNLPVGLIGLLNIDMINSKAEFYISMGREDYKKKGIATLSSKMLLECSFKQMGLNKVYLNVDEANVAACRLYEKVGFVLEGKFQQELFFKGRFINRLRYAAFSEKYFSL